MCYVLLGGNQDGKFSVGFRDGVVRTVVGLDRETQAAYTLIVEAIGALSFYIFTFMTMLPFILNPQLSFVFAAMLGCCLNCKAPSF